MAMGLIRSGLFAVALAGCTGTDTTAPQIDQDPFFDLETRILSANVPLSGHEQVPDSAQDAPPYSRHIYRFGNGIFGAQVEDSPSVLLFAWRHYEGVSNLESYTLMRHVADEVGDDMLLELLDQVHMGGTIRTQSYHGHRVWGSCRAEAGICTLKIVK